MPPHCDALDGPVVKAAQRALEAQDVNLVLPYVHKDGEAEVVKAFEKVTRIRESYPGAREIADLHFFETVVRVHRGGEGAPYTGLKPAGLDVGPAIPAAERAIESGSAEELLELLTDTVRSEVMRRFDRVMELRPQAEGSVDQAREYVQAMLGLQVYSHKLYKAMKAGPHGGGEEHG
jgi:hypothetical protein